MIITDATAYTLTLAQVSDSNQIIRSDDKIHASLNFDQSTNLFSNDGNFEIQVPPNSVSSDDEVTVVISSVSFAPGPPPKGKKIIGSVYEIRISNTDALINDAIVSMSYHPEVMGNYNNIAIYRWDPIEDIWQSIGGEVDMIRNTIISLTNHGSIYALIGEFVQPAVDSRALYLPIFMK